MKLSSFLKACVLRIGVDSFSFKSFFDDFAFDQLLSPPVILHGPNNFRICRNDILLYIGLFWSLIILNPRGSIFLVARIIEGALGCSSESVVSRSIHRGFIYNLNNILD